MCFHCQQCVEKYLKGLLEELGLTVPKTHDLGHLLADLIPRYPSLRSLRRGLVSLTAFAVRARYPGMSATKRQATSALGWADLVRTSVRALLGAPRRRTRRKKSS